MPFLSLGSDCVEPTATRRVVTTHNGPNHVPSSKLPSIPVDEFICAFQLAMGLSGGTVALIHVPSNALLDARARPPMHQLGLVLRDRYQADRGKIESTLFRILALQKILESPLIKESGWVDARIGDYVEIDEAAFEVAATIPLNDERMFDTRAFILSLGRSRVR